MRLLRFASLFLIFASVALCADRVDPIAVTLSLAGADAKAAAANGWPNTMVLPSGTAGLLEKTEAGHPIHLEVEAHWESDKISITLADVEPANGGAYIVREKKTLLLAEKETGEAKMQDFTFIVAAKKWDGKPRKSHR